MWPSTCRRLQVMSGVRWILPALCVLMVGCAGSPWKREFVYSSSGVSLYHEYQEAESGRVDLGYKHPIDLSVDNASMILSQLVYKKTYLFKKAEKKYVFRPDEIRVFVPRLVLALKELAPDERLRFLVIRSNWSDVLLGTTGTSGVVFSTEEGVIQLAFDLVNDKFSGDEDGNPENVVFRLDPTAYRGGSPLLARPGIRPHVDVETGKSVPRWLEIRVAEIQPFKRQEVAKPTPPAKPLEGAVTVPERPDLSDSAAPSKEGGTTTASAGGTQVSEPAGAGVKVVAGEEPDEEKRYQELRERIETLKRLRDDGVLTEEEFQKSYEKAITEATEN